MNKQEFLNSLEKGLVGLPQEDIRERVMFYGEIIDDRIEDGLLENDAVAQIGSVDEVVAQIVAETSFKKLVNEKIKRKGKLSVLEIVLLILGAPIWFSLLVAAVVVAVSLYISVWAIIISLWSVFAAFIGCVIGGVAACAVFAFTGHIPTGIAMLATAFVCAGLAIFSFFGCREVTNGIFWLTKKVIIGIKKCFVKKGEA